MAFNTLSSPDADSRVERVVRLAAEHLDMEIAWVARFAGDQYVFETLSGDGTSFGARPGHAILLEGTFCARMVRGDLPNVVPDARRDPRTRELPATKDRAIGAYVGVPLTLADGQTYGALCCLSHEPDPTLNARDVRFVELLARVLAEELDRDRALADADAERRARVQVVLGGDGLTIVYQLIVALADGRVVGAEALSRFAEGNPAQWFVDAELVGLGAELELAAIRAALVGLDRLDDDVYLSINASPEVASSSRLHTLLAAHDPERIQLEVTERAQVERYEELLAALDRLRGLGVRVAVDDAGAGYAGLSHILRLAPETIKLDITLSRDIDRDPAREALARSLVAFADQIDAHLIAEGVETEAELECLAGLGVGAAQGYLLARPDGLPLTLAGAPRRRSRPATPGR